MAFTQTQRVDEDAPRDENRLKLEIDVMTQTSVPRCDVGRNGDGRLPPGKHTVLVYESDLHCVDLKTEKYPSEVERAKSENMARRHDFIRDAKTGMPDGYALPHNEAALWDGVPLPGLEGKVADAVRSAAWRFPGSWQGVYLEMGTTRNADGTKRGPGSIRSYKILETLPPPTSKEVSTVEAIVERMGEKMGDKIAEALAGRSQNQQQRNDRK